MGRYDSRSSNASRRIIGLLIVVVIATTVGVYLCQPEQDQPAEVRELTIPAKTKPAPATGENEEPVPAAAQQSQVSSEPVPSSELPPPEALPALDASDEFFRTQITRLSSDFTPLLATDDLVRKFVRVANDFSQAQRSYKHMRYFLLSDPFPVVQKGGDWYLAEQGYRRYDWLARAFEQMDAALAVNAYRLLRPLLQQAFAEFGYPEHYRLEDIIQKAAGEMLAAPIVQESVPVYKAGLMYKYTDRELEELSPVQKQMLRMGPDNTRKIQSKLRSILELMMAGQES